MPETPYPVRNALAIFDEKVAMRYQLFNSLFLTLPFEELSEVGTELPLFHRLAEEGLEKGHDPVAIVEYFFQKRDSEGDGEVDIERLFQFLRYIERQVVLFDALEEASFEEVNDMKGVGTIPHLIRAVRNERKQEELSSILKDYRVRLVLTAHPTQFYPGSVLGIISNLSDAIKGNHLSEVQQLLLQLGKTPFSKKEKPTPFEEAKALNWNLINIFYPVVAEMKFALAEGLEDPFEVLGDNPLLEIGFWPGGDRDGNPFVTHETTLQVAQLLKKSVLDCYHKDIRVLKRRLTFEGILDSLEDIQDRLSKTYEATLQDEIHTEGYANAQAFMADLLDLRKALIADHQSLFLEHLDRLIFKVSSFGFHFAVLDLRQDSRVHRDALLDACLGDSSLKQSLSPELVSNLGKWDELSDDEKHNHLIDILESGAKPNSTWLGEGDELNKEVLRTASIIPTIHHFNGQRGLSRYIISNTQRSADVLTALTFCRWSGVGDETPMDIVPLFETIEDLTNAETIMENLYTTPLYRRHLELRGLEQTIMLGFSDGTKDGGTVSANWSIHQAKVRLSSISERYGIQVHFFDGRGGPPARGGGNTHKYYRAQGTDIHQDQIQLTIQGQTISTQFGSLPSARYNFEELFTASLHERLFSSRTPEEKTQFKKKENALMEELSTSALQAYRTFKEHPLFVPYLQEVTPLLYIGRLNIASRPTKRKAEGPMKFEDLRAIPFVTSWAQMKQNIPGYYGLGSAIEAFLGDGRQDDITWLYKNSLFFRTLVENSMQSLAKSRMELTTHLSRDERFAPFWQLIQNEVDRCRSHLKTISRQKKLMDSTPATRASIDLREKVVFPLLIIQQYALESLRSNNELTDEKREALEKLILKTLAANINASRNSA
jgi:phosphoenolpyruvate carboxylase